jgi:PTH1 family peptidyl-tRNA hydrolase
LGEVKLQFGRGAAGHKGVESVISFLGTKDFWRLRFGIGEPSEGVEGEQYVLGDFNKEELPFLENAFSDSLQLIKKHLLESDR